MMRKPVAERVPVASVVMTVRNGQKYVRAACESILAQTLAELEFIVVDDGSTDATPAILLDLAQCDRRVRIITLEPSGIPRAANAGVRSARATLVARLDADDIALPQRLATQVAYLAKRPEILCLGSSVEFIDEQGRYLTCMTPPGNHEEIQKELLRGRCPIWHTSSIIRKDALQQIGFYDESYDCASDLDLFLRIGEIGMTANYPAPLQQYRLHADSISERHLLRQRECARQACNNAARRRGIESRFHEEEYWRPDTSRSSRLKFSLRYGRWAFDSGQRRTAMHYGLRAVRLCPWSRDAWRLLVHSACK